jgi:hypothetical protein
MFSLGFSNMTLASVVAPIFQHLRTELDATDAWYLDIVETKHDVRVLHGDRIIGQCLSAREIAPLLHGLMGLLAIRSYGYLLAVHASCLVQSGNILMLAGRSGSGKSTMTAALMALGWGYMSDDTALLLPETLECVGVPYALTIKEGSWPHLKRYFPTIDQTAVHLRSDDRLVRYLCPDHHSSLKSRPVRWIGFPHYSATATSSIELLDEVDGLYRLLEHCCAIPHLLSSRDVQQLVQWSAGVRFFEFAISDIDEAIAQVTAIIGEEAD